MLHSWLYPFSSHPWFVALYCCPVSLLSFPTRRSSVLYQSDPEFWLKIINEPGQTRMENRHIEKAMLNQVIKTNDNKLDKFLGISYVRENNIFNLERDFAAQIYSLGWIGMLIFVGPYLAILLYAAYRWLRYQSARTYLVSSLFASSAFILLPAFYSGNVMDFLTASFFFAFIRSEERRVGKECSSRWSPNN